MIIYVNVPIVLPGKMVVVVHQDQRLEVEGSLTQIDEFEGLRKNLRGLGVKHGKKLAKENIRNLLPLLLDSEVLDRAVERAEPVVLSLGIGKYSYDEAEEDYTKAFCEAYREEISSGIDNNILAKVWPLVIENRKRELQQTQVLDSASNGKQVVDIRLILQLDRLLKQQDLNEHDLEEVNLHKEVYGALYDHVIEVEQKGGAASSPPQFF